MSPYHDEIETRNQASGKKKFTSLYEYFKDVLNNWGTVGTS